MSVVVDIDVIMADVVPWKAIVGSPWHMEPLAGHSAGFPYHLPRQRLPRAAPMLWIGGVRQRTGAGWLQNQVLHLEFLSLTSSTFEVI